MKKKSICLMASFWLAVVLSLLISPLACAANNSQASDALGQLWLKGKISQIKLAPKKYLVNRFRHERSQKQFYYTKISYPQITGRHLTKADYDFNKMINQIIKDNRTLFFKAMKANMDALQGQKRAGMPVLSSNSNNLIIDSEVLYTTDNLISVRFTISTYFYGAAHPTSHSVTLNYDLKKARALKLAELFPPKSDYLKKLSVFCQKALINKILPKAQAKLQSGAAPLHKFMIDWIKKGTAAKAKNYIHWNRVAKGVLITFDPYQVASHAMGRLQVLVPLESSTAID